MVGEFEKLKQSPGAEVYMFPYTPVGLKLFEDHAISMRNAGYRVVSSPEEHAGHKLHVMVCVPAPRPTRAERGCNGK